MRKLFVVTVETEVVVVANDAAEAETIAEGNYRMESMDFSAHPMRYLPCDWESTDVPFGGDGEVRRSIADWTEAGAAPEYKELMMRFAKAKPNARNEPVDD